MLELIPGVGIAAARFGMSEAEVRLALGAPDKTYEDAGTKHLLFNELRADVWIDLESHGRFEWVACAHPEAYICDRPAVGRPLDQVLRHLANKLGDADIEFEDFGAFESRTFIKHWLELQSEFGVVTSVGLGNLFNESEEPIWPS